jgi:deoxyribonuclease V
MEHTDSRKKELEKKYGIDFERLEKEQIQLAKDLEIKDAVDFSHAEKFGAFDTLFIKNKILCCVIVCSKNFEIIEQAYAFEKTTFPYYPGFRNYRELPAMMAAFEKLNEKPDVLLVTGQGIIHPRLGLASHCGLATGIPTIGVSNVLIDCQIEGKGKDGDYIIKNGKKVGRIVVGKEGSNPLYISPGNKISIKSAYELTKKLIQPPHKRPEPLHLAAKYSKKVKEELSQV